MPIPVALTSNNFHFAELDGMFRQKRDAEKVLLNYNPYNQEVMTVSLREEKLTIKSTSIRADICKRLYESGKESLVGKGKETVLDRDVRRSRELASSEIEFGQDFFAHLIDGVRRCVEKMGAGNLVRLTPHKLIIYGKDDFFSEHMDAVHTPGQTMTAVVIFQTEHEGGSLEVSGANFKAGPSVVVFYGDQPHQVHPVTNGYRVVLTFDLEIDPLRPQEAIDGETAFKPESVSQVVDRLKRMKVKRFGFFATQRYLEDQQLKGDDARTVEHFRPFIDDEVERLDLMTKDCRNWYDPSVWEFKNSGPDSGRCLIDYYSDEENEPEDYSKPQVPAKNEAIPDSWCPGDERHVFRDEFCLGDVFQLWSPHLPRLSQYGDTEIHLGNEGFFGEVHQNLFIVMTLK
jgi:hypothetical protein